MEAGHGGWEVGASGRITVAGKGMGVKCGEATRTGGGALVLKAAGLFRLWTVTEDLGEVVVDI